VVINGICDVIIAILEESHPQTVRQVFYALTVRGRILKIEQEYHRTVVRLLVDLREDGKVPFDWIADNTRWQRKPSSFTGIESGLENFARAIGAISGRRRPFTSKYGARRTPWPVSFTRRRRSMMSR
jgi:hypothetical protein